MTGALHDDVGGDADQGSAHVFVLMEKPGRPVAVSPAGRVDVARPTFQWTRAIRAATYEVRVYRGTRLVLKHAGVRVPATSWVCDSRLPRRVELTWKVRARNAAGFGPWSKPLAFRLR